ncbi:hypothetical protein HS088_TW21G00166 [Tripterygium wilfordii]|uniref:Fiber protein Fb34 n=1 Tax=Tripterygium wilfordii TaxID=458696 RepID=A0A7J7C1K9_TRIWF|nr:hypothetical protein HS088_TW21G00166 [Tripterygium wilfordii]
MASKLLLIAVFVFDLIAFGLAIAAEQRRSTAVIKQDPEVQYNYPPSCETVRKGVFAAGAAFIFFTAIVSQFYYICYSKARESFQPYGRDTGVGTGTYK